MSEEAEYRSTKNTAQSLSRAASGPHYGRSAAAALANGFAQRIFVGSSGQLFRSRDTVPDVPEQRLLTGGMPLGRRSIAAWRLRRLALSGMLVVGVMILHGVCSLSFTCLSIEWKPAQATRA
jgi:hypothetical protein